jgi:hypothetical protein
MRVGDVAQVRMDVGSITVGQSIVEFSEEGFQLATRANYPESIPMQKKDQMMHIETTDYTEKIDLLISLVKSFIEIMEDIRYFSVPWYIRAYRWIKEKF